MREQNSTGTEPGSPPDSRILREKDFHNSAYESRARQGLAPLYDRSNPIRRRYENLLLSNCAGKKVLEYGCGMGSYGFLLAKNGARVTGIDISDFAIQEARKKAQTDIVDISFRVMDAESLELPESSIDLICGTGILHHLSLERALPQIERVLAPNGKAYFIEPLGHNPVINFYRRLTPSLRSRDEHPLNAGDLGVIGTLFHRHSFEFYDLLTLFFLPFHKFRIFRPAHEFLTKLDHATFAVIPFLRKYSWQVLIILEK